MPQAFTSYVVDNDRKFRDAIARAQLVSSDLRIPFGQILSDFYKSEQAIFGLKGPGQYPPFQGRKGYDGNTSYQRWKLGLSKPKKDSKNKRTPPGFDYPLIVSSGAASASLLSANAPGSIALIGPTQLIFGSAIEYLIYHNSDAPRKKIPLRKVLFIGPEASQFATSEMQGRPERWLNIMNDYVMAKIRQSGAAS